MYAVFIFTAKLPRRRIKVGAALLTILCCGTLVLNFGPSLSLEVSATAAPTAPSPKGVNSAEKRLEYLNAWGWQVEETQLSSEELLIPEEMDESYNDYLALQLEQGFDLSGYCGKRVKRYTYAITNYPSGETGVQVNLLIYRGKVIGGEVLSPTLDGFLHGLAMP